MCKKINGVTIDLSEISQLKRNDNDYSFSYKLKGSSVSETVKLDAATYETIVSELMSVIQNYFSEKYMLGKFLINRSKHENGLQISYVQPNELDVNEIAKVLYSFMNNAPFELLASVNIKNIALGIIALESVKVSKRSVILTKCLYVNNYRGNASFESQSNFHYFLCALMLHYDLKGIKKIAYDNSTVEYFIDYLGHTYYVNIINNFEVDLPQMNMRFTYNKLGTCTFEFENENSLQNFLTFLKL